MPITTAIIVVAGFGTRFAPATKEQPKEMFPIGNKPIVHWIVEQLSDAGVKHFILVTRPNENTTPKYFARNTSYETHLNKQNKKKLLREFEMITELGHFSTTTQDYQNGDGDAFLKGIENRSPEPYIVVFPDFLVKPEEKIFTRLIDAYRTHRCPIIAMDEVPNEQLNNYGVIGFEEVKNSSTYKINKFVEKPKNLKDAPSNCVSIGYSIVTPDLVNYLKTTVSSVGDGEIRIADALVNMVADGKDVRGIKLKQNGYDCGQPRGWLKANIDFMLNSDDREEIITMLKDTVSELNLEKEKIKDTALKVVSGK
jgi:UTP--glucose-1-phosphate uridylyltransferase